MNLLSCVLNNHTDENNHTDRKKRPQSDKKTVPNKRTVRKDKNLIIIQAEIIINTEKHFSQTTCFYFLLPMRWLQ